VIRGPNRCAAHWWLALLVWILPNTGFAADEADPELPIALGDVIDGWTVERIDQQNEFVRYWFQGDDLNTGVEVTYLGDRTGSYVAGEYLIQSAPGEVPPESLLEAVTALFAEYEQESEPAFQGHSPNRVASGTQLVPYRRVAFWLSVLLSLIAIIGVARLAHSERKVLFNRFDLLVGVGLLVAGGGLLLTTQVPIALTPDLARDLLVGRDCWAGSECSAGPQTSFLGLLQGTTWPRLSSFVLSEQALGGATVGTLFSLLAAFGICLVYASARLSSGRKRALLAGFFYTAGFCLAMPGGEFSNHTAVAIAAPATLYAAVLQLRTQNLLQAVALGLCCGLAAESHSACWWFLVAASVQVWSTSRRPIMSLAACWMGCLLPTFALSPLSLIANAKQFVVAATWIGVLAILAAVAVLGVWLRRRRRDPIEVVGYRLFVGLWSSIYAVLAIAVLLSGRQFLLIYTLPVLPFAAVSAADGVGRLVSRYRRTDGTRLVRTAAVTGVTVSLLAGVWVAGMGLSQRLDAGRNLSAHLSFDHTKAIAEELYRETTFPTLATAIRSPNSHHLLTALAALDPASGSNRDGRAVLVVDIATERIPDEPDPGWVIQPRTGGRSTAIHRFESALDLSSVTVCYRTESERDCVQRDFSHYVESNAPGFRWSERAFPSLSPPRLASPAEPYTAVYRFRVDSDMTERRIIEFGTAQDLNCPWEIVATAGLEFEGTLPTNRFEFSPRAGESEAWLEVSRQIGEAGCPPVDEYFPPGIFELPESDYGMIEGVRTHGAIDEWVTR